MRKHNLLLLLLVFAVLLTVIPISAQDDDELQTGPAMVLKQLRIYAEQKGKSKTLALVEPGEMVNIVSIDGTWKQVEYNDVVGWTRASDTIVNASAPVPLIFDSGMVYDSESDRIILFGGSRVLPDYETWAYDLNTNTWTKMSPDNSPYSGELTMPMVYDSQSDRAILYVGFSQGRIERTPETWAYDYNSDTWTNMQPEISPPRISGANIIYDVESDRVLLFGGVDDTIADEMDYAALQEVGYPISEDVWAYDFESNTWIQFEPTSDHHPLIVGAASGYNPLTDEITIFGGDTELTPNNRQFTNEAWIYNFNENLWTQLEFSTNYPTPRIDARLFHLQSTSQSLLIGGVSEEITAYGSLTILNDMWLYDYNTNTWTLLDIKTHPNYTPLDAAVYHSGLNKIVVFGIASQKPERTTLDELQVLVFDLETFEWSELNP